MSLLLLKQGSRQTKSFGHFAARVAPFLGSIDSKLGIGVILSGRTHFNLPEHIFVGFSSPARLLQSCQAWGVLERVTQVTKTIDQDLILACYRYPAKCIGREVSQGVLAKLFGGLEQLEQTESNLREIMTRLPEQDELDWMICELLLGQIVPDGWELWEALQEGTIMSSVPVRFAISRSKEAWEQHQQSSSSMGPKRYSHEW